MSDCKETLVQRLTVRGSAAHRLWQEAYALTGAVNGELVFLRGLLEFSNNCAKDCYYCGLRSSNTAPRRFTLTKEQIVHAARSAQQQKLGSITLQSGECASDNNTIFVEEIIKTIRQELPELRIVLSCGEQTREVYKTWAKAGADRYLLKIETSNPRLYAKLHPQNKLHDLDARINCLQNLKDLGYQTGSGIMTGLPWQSAADIAEDILFFKKIDIDMAGLGPYIEHSQTPLYDFKEELPPVQERLVTALNAVAALRAAMPDINIAAATSFDALHPRGKELAVTAGANVIMLNLTPGTEKADYSLYQRPQESLDKDILNELKKYGRTVAYGQSGDSKHFTARTK